MKYKLLQDDTATHGSTAMHGSSAMLKKNWDCLIET